MYRIVKFFTGFLVHQIEYFVNHQEFAQYFAKRSSEEFRQYEQMVESSFINQHKLECSKQLNARERKIQVSFLIYFLLV